MIARIEQPWKALSCHAPWAYSLIYLGKGVENRTSRTPGKPGGYTFPRSVLGRVWIHASMWPVAGPLKPNSVPRTQFLEEMGSALRIRNAVRTGIWTSFSNEELATKFNDITQTAINIRGHIIGSVEVYDYRGPHEAPGSPWYVPGSLAIMVRDPQPLATPVPAKGALGWWTPSDEVLAQLGRAQA